MIGSTSSALRTTQVCCVLATIVVVATAQAQEPVAPAPAATSAVPADKPAAGPAAATDKPAATPAAATDTPAATPAATDKPEAAAAPGAAKQGAAAGESKPKSKALTAVIGAPPGWNRANTWDLELEGALGSTLGDGHRGSRFGRARAGYLAVRDEMLYAVTLSYQYANLVPHTFGLQAEFTNDNTAFWAQVGGLLDTRGHPGVMAAAGLTIVGVEGEYRRYDDLGAVFTLYAKLRVPIGIVAYQLR